MVVLVKTSSPSAVVVLVKTLTIIYDCVSQNKLAVNTTTGDGELVLTNTTTCDGELVLTNTTTADGELVLTQPQLMVSLF